MNYLTIGRFTLPVSLPSIILAVLISYFIFIGKEKKKPGDWYWNSLLLFVLVYKLSYALFHFSLFLSFPMSLLYFNGGSKGQLIAAVFIAMYIFRVYKRQNADLYEMSFILLITFFAFQAVYNLLDQNFVFAGIQVIILLGYSQYMYSGRKKKQKTQAQMVLFVFLIDLFFLSLFNQLFLSYNLSFIFINFFLIITYYFSKEGQEV